MKYFTLLFLLVFSLTVLPTEECFAQHKKKKAVSFKKTRRRAGRLDASKKNQLESKQGQASDFRGSEPFFPQLPGPNPGSQFRGTTPLTGSGNRDANQYKMSNYRGNEPVKNKYGREINQYRLSEYRGTILIADPSRREIGQYRASTFIGKVGVESVVAKRIKYDQESFALSGFKGEKVLSPQIKRQNYEIAGWHLSRFKGEKMRLNQPEGAYPDIVYQEARFKGSYAAKEKFRKKQLKNSSKHTKRQVPPAMWNQKDETTVPSYDSRESEIWVKPRNADGTEMQVEPRKKGLKGLFKKKDKRRKMERDLAPPPEKEAAPTEEKK
jgi:hypothetical protein